MTLSQHPDFLRLWAGQTVSVFGSLVTRTAVPFTAVLALDATPGQMALLGVADLLPAAIAAPLAGAWVDRLPRRLLLIGADLLRALVLLAVPVAALAGVLSMGLLYGVALTSGVLTAVFDVAYLAYLPSLVGEERLMQANSRMSGSSAVAEVAAFPAGGWLVQLFSGPVALLIDAASFVVSAVCVALIRTPEPARPAAEATPDLLGELGEGLRALLSDRVLVAVAVIGGLMDLASRLAGTVFLLYVTADLGFEPGVLGLVFATGGLSSLMGAVLAGRVTRRLGTGRAMALAILTTGVALLLVPLARGRTIASALLLVGQQLLGDGAATAWEISQTTEVQRRSPPHLLGRISGSLRSVSWAALLTGALLGGLLGETIGLRSTLTVGAAGVLMAGVYLACSPARGLR